MSEKQSGEDSSGEASRFFEDVIRERDEQRAASKVRAEVEAKEVGRRLRAVRGDVPRRYVLEKLEDEHGIAMLNSTLAAIEAGERPVRLSEAVALASIYGVHVDAFISDDPSNDDQTRVDELERLKEYVQGRLETFSERNR
jgi:hypothetical protein